MCSLKELANRHLATLKQELIDLGAPEDLASDMAIGCNVGHFSEHGTSPLAISRAAIAKDGLTKFFSDPKRVTPKRGDRVILHATGRKDGDTKTYTQALITDVEGNLVEICVAPYTPFIGINMDTGTLYSGNGGLNMSVSGGYFQNVSMGKLYPTEPIETPYCFWGTRPEANGAVTIFVKAKTWVVTSDEFY